MEISNLSKEEYYTIQYVDDNNHIGRQIITPSKLQVDGLVEEFISNCESNYGSDYHVETTCMFGDDTTYMYQDDYGNTYGSLVVFTTEVYKEI